MLNARLDTRRTRAGQYLASLAPAASVGAQLPATMKGSAGNAILWVIENTTVRQPRIKAWPAPPALTRENSQKGAIQAIPSAQPVS